MAIAEKVATLRETRFVTLTGVAVAMPPITDIKSDQPDLMFNWGNDTEPTYVVYGVENSPPLVGGIAAANSTGTLIARSGQPGAVTTYANYVHGKVFSFHFNGPAVGTETASFGIANNTIGNGDVGELNFAINGVETFDVFPANQGTDYWGSFVPAGSSAANPSSGFWLSYNSFTDPGGEYYNARYQKAYIVDNSGITFHNAVNIGEALDDGFVIWYGAATTSDDEYNYLAFYLVKEDGGGSFIEGAFLVGKWQPGDYVPLDPAGGTWNYELFYGKFDDPLINSLFLDDYASGVYWNSRTKDGWVFIFNTAPVTVVTVDANFNSYDILIIESGDAASETYLSGVIDGSIYPTGIYSFTDDKVYLTGGPPDVPIMFAYASEPAPTWKYIPPPELYILPCYTVCQPLYIGRK